MDGPRLGRGRRRRRRPRAVPPVRAAAHLPRPRGGAAWPAGTAYRCFCSPEQLEADRQAALRRGPAAEVRRPLPRHLRATRRGGASRTASRRSIRFRVPATTGTSSSDDLVRGEVRFSTEVIGDPVLVRSDGVPAYNFAVVIDDALMEITHVIRGEDHISNTPRQMLLYEAFGWTPPAFAHVSLVMGPDHAPLSKRHGATSVAEFRERGYLPEALTNYLALLGWSPGEGEELLPLDELARRFRLEDVGHSAGVFDVEKLAWVNRHYLKTAAPERLARWRCRTCSRRDGCRSRRAADLAFLATSSRRRRPRVDRLEQVPRVCGSCSTTRPRARSRRPRFARRRERRAP